MKLPIVQISPWECNGTVHQLFTDVKKAYDSVSKEILNNILTEFGILRKLDGLVKMCLNETYSIVHVSKVCLTSFLFYENRMKKLIAVLLRHVINS
jgi:hypothetical protein